MYNILYNATGKKLQIKECFCRYCYGHAQKTYIHTSSIELSKKRDAQIKYFILGTERVTACRHPEAFDPGTTYIYKCDLLVSFISHHHAA